MTLKCVGFSTEQISDYLEHTAPKVGDNPKDLVKPRNIGLYISIYQYLLHNEQENSVKVTTSCYVIFNSKDKTPITV